MASGQLVAVSRNSSALRSFPKVLLYDLGAHVAETGSRCFKIITALSRAEPSELIHALTFRYGDET